jgi:phosphoribosyl-AMP cyclohydrolase
MKFKHPNGLVPAIIQEKHSGKVLMLGHMNKQAYDRTVSTGYVTFFSRSRRKLWTKGESSGHRLRVSEIRADCDRDALLILADLTGPGCCHLGYKSCFFRKLTPDGEKVIANREFDPEEIYGESLKESRT